MLKVISTVSEIKEKNILKLSEVSNSFRLNASHFTKENLDKTLKSLENIFQKHNIDKTVIIDLQGAKKRIGKFPSLKALPESITIKNIKSSNNPQILPLPDKAFFDYIKKGDFIYLNDAEIKLEVKNRDNQNIYCKVHKNGSISSNKGINIKNSDLEYTEITDIDKEHIQTGNKYDFTEFALSFVLNGKEYDILKRYTNKKITAKIERPESLEFIKEIDEKFDKIWFCRGDMGAQAGIENLGKIQYEFTQKIKNLKSDVYLAGQVLYSITKFSIPTRTEIVSLYSMEKENYKGFVLSDETVLNENTDKVVQFLKQVLK